MGAHPEDDGGLSVCSYFTLSGRASGLLAAGRATPALGLWRRFVEEGVSTKEGISFKVVGRVEDLEKYEVPAPHRHTPMERGPARSIPAPASAPLRS